MSLAISPLDVVEIIEPTIKMNERKVFAVFKGGSDNIYYNYSANSSSNSQAIWNINVPSENIFIDRKIYLKARLRLTFTGTTPDPSQFLLQTGFDALRAYPLSNATNTMTVQINNGAVSLNMGDIVQPLMRYVGQDEEYFEYSNAPSMLDQSQTYEELTSTTRNPLNGLGDSTPGAFLPRGAFPVNVISNTDTGAVVEVEIEEPLMISPLHFNRSRSNGFIGVKNFNFSVIWNQNLGAKLWSHNNNSGSTINTLQVEFLGDPELSIRTITPSEIDSLQLPELTVYPYHDIQRYTTDGVPVAPGATGDKSTDSIQLSVIPRRLFMFIRRRNGDETINTTDSFLSIESISVNFGNRSGLLSSASKRDLYNMSRKNGCNMTWTEWSGEDVPFLSGNTNSVKNGVGSVLCLYIPEDIALTNSDLLAPGVSEKVNLQIRVSYKNNHPTETINPQIYVVVDNEGLFTITNGLGLAQIGVLNKEDVLNAQPMEGVNYEDVLDLYGGDFWSGIGSFFKKLPGRIQKGAKFIKEDVMPIAKQLAPILMPLMGLGEMEGKGLVGGMITGGKGGMITGGKLVRRQQLRDRLKRN